VLLDSFARGSLLSMFFMPLPYVPQPWRVFFPAMFVFVVVPTLGTRSC
jgi:hypothetical protein